jgi:hypothetical protein
MAPEIQNAGKVPVSLAAWFKGLGVRSGKFEAPIFFGDLTGNGVNLILSSMAS